MVDSRLEMDAYHQDVDRHYRRNAIGIMLDNAMFYIISLGLSQYTILPLYLSKLTSSKVLIGLIPTVYIVGFAIPQLFVARFLKGKRRTKKYILITAVAQRVSILAFLVLTLVQTHLSANLTIVLFFLIYVAQNFITGMWFPMWVDFIGRAIPRKRGMVFGLSYLFGGILSLIGGGLITYLLKALPYPNAISAAAAIAFAASMVSLLIITTWHETPMPVPAQPLPEGHPEHNLFHKIKTDRNFQNYIVWRGVIIGIEMSLSYITISAVDRLHIADSQVGIFSIILSISQTVMNVFWGWLGDRIGYLKIILFSTLLGGIGAFLSAGAGSILMFYIVFFLAGAMMAGQQLSNINIIYEFAHNDVPTYIAVNQIVLSPLSGVAPIIGGVLVSQVGYGWLFSLAGAFALAGLTGMALKVKNPFKPHPHSLVTQEAS
jgi:MFS family permease